MYVPGANQQSNPPLQFLIAHEYGHHIEMNRSNAPWVAFDTGVKNWFTYEQVCTRMRDRKLGTNYWNDPSEGFAESYADSQYPGVAFPFSSLMLPNQGAYNAIRQDVLAGGQTIAKGARGTTTIKTLCGVRSLTLQVTRTSGSGPFSLIANLP